ncbi:MAG: deoxyribodipyrimidine photo-lyase, partial [Hydrocarboniphaga effusa]|nr:deoxyribodipyrimidine photo-lyase [Hydrocarboniphaga effusa]
MERKHRCALVWFRRDLRLTDNPALVAALQSAATIVPVYIHDPQAEGEWAPGAASRVWLHHSLAALAANLRQRGAPLVIHRGPTLENLMALTRESGATAVCWNRLYEPTLVERDRRVQAALTQAGIETLSANAALWAEPWAPK